MNINTLDDQAPDQEAGPETALSAPASKCIDLRYVEGNKKLTAPIDLCTEPEQAVPSSPGRDSPSMIIPATEEHPAIALLRLLHPDINWDGKAPETPGRRSRYTDIKRFTPLSQVKNARNGYLYSRDHLKSPLNTFLTINFNRHRRHWEKGKDSHKQVPYVRDKLIKALNDWCDYNEVPRLWIYGIENPSEGGHGPHMHLLLHLPQDRWEKLTASLGEFLSNSMEWSAQDLKPIQERIAAVNCSLEDRMRRSELWLPFHISPADRGEWRPLSEREARIKLAYICKSVDPNAIVEIDGRTQTIEAHASSGPTCDITLQDCGDPRTKRRIGTSQPLSIGERQKAGWTEDDNCDWLSRKVQDRRWRDGICSRIPSPVAETTGHEDLPSENEAATTPVEGGIDLEKLVLDLQAMILAGAEESREQARDLRCLFKELIPEWFSSSVNAPADDELTALLSDLLLEGD
jgi:hypothetical protein